MIISKDLNIEKAAVDYKNAKPFPHVVIDNFLDKNVAELAWKDMQYIYPNEKWYHYNSAIEKKYATDNWELFPGNIRLLLAYLNTGMFIKTFEDITGIQGLIGDPSLRGGGIHCILPGGKLDIHADRGIHPTLSLYRRINVIIYLNKNWRDSYNGLLEFWNKGMTKCEKKISPDFNRMVIFETSASSFHGHPDTLVCPIGESRKSLALYYWTSSVPEGFDLNKGSTDFRARPEDKTNEEIDALRIKRRAEVPKK